MLNIIGSENNNHSFKGVTGDIVPYIPSLFLSSTWNHMEQPPQNLPKTGPIFPMETVGLRSASRAGELELPTGLLGAAGLQIPRVCSFRSTVDQPDVLWI